MKKFLVSLSTCFILVGLSVPTITFATEPPLEEGAIIDTQLSQTQEERGFVPCSGTNCSACDLVKLANTIIKWLIGILFIIFAILVAVAGARLVTSGGNQSAKEAAKSSLTNAIIGIIIILAAWLLVDTIMRALLGNSGQFTGGGPWSEVACQRQESPSFQQFQVAEIEHVIRSGGEHSVASAATAGSGGGSNCPAATEDTVVTIPGTSFKARPEIAENFVRMREAAKSDGITLTVTSGWRSEATQVRLFNQICPGGTCGRRKAARPCSMDGNGSNHNSGLAIDISVGCGNGQANCNTRTFNWLKQNGEQFGFRNNLPTDPVHWSPSGR
jgi:hypothetical protein